MKKVPLRPTSALKQQKQTATGAGKKAGKQEALPIADQILILQARLIQIEICLNNVKNDQELLEKKRKVFDSVQKLVELDTAVNEYAAKINEKVAYEHNKRIVDNVRQMMATEDLAVNPFDQFRLDHDKYEKYLLKKAQQVHLKGCEATQGVLLKSIEEAIPKCRKTIQDLQVKHEITVEELEKVKSKSVIDLETVESIDAKNQEFWAQASQELDALYQSLSDLLLETEI